MTSFPKKLNLGSGKDFREDFLNLDKDPTWKPDIIMDLEEPFFGADSNSPSSRRRFFETERFGRIEVQRGSFDNIIAYDVLEHIRNLATAMRTCLDLLREGGLLNILVPYDLSYGAWQDPTHVRAFNEKSWAYYTDWFWYMGWREAKFALEMLELVPSELGKRLGIERKESLMEIALFPRAVDSMKVLLKKIVLRDRDKAAFGYFHSRAKGTT